MSDTLSGQVALVTGAARGIGRCIASRFLEQGCTVYVADVDGPGVRRCASEFGPSALGLEMDVRDGSAVRAAVDHILHQHSRLDVLINNAGIVATGPFADTSAEAWDRLLAVNVTGVFNCVQAVAPTMIQRRAGTILNLASVSAMRGGGAVGNVWYGATKAAVVALTKGLARELGAHGVRVNAIAPGLVETDMVKDALSPEVHQRVLARFPLGRLGTMDDVAQLALFLSSDASSFITGQTIAVDGGFLTT